jgi:multidrug efflux pump subunit AcrA (membrane-fusion protein)
MQFRHKALAKLQSPEELDLPVRFARPQGWLVLSVTIVVMAVAAFWAATGSVSSKLSAPGILTYGEGSYILQSPVSGQVTQILAHQGQQLSAEAPLLKVHTQQGDSVIRTIVAGRVTELAATIGAIVTTGADVASVERIAHPGDPLVAMLYVPAANAASVPEGGSVDLAVESVSEDKYGTLHGRVKAVGRASETEQQITSFLGDGQLAKEFSQQGPPVPVLVQLDASSTTKSGYVWSTSAGPPYKIDSMTLTTGAVHLAAQRPMDWLLS